MSTSLTVVLNFGFPAPILNQIREAAQAEVIYQEDRTAFKEALFEAEIACGFLPTTNWREIAPHLRWLQTPSAGIDRLLGSSLLAPDSGVTVTTASGIHIYSISEYVFGSMLMFNRSWPKLVELQSKHIWPKSPNEYPLQERELVDRTLGIIGLGNIGRRIAQIGRAFGMKILASRSSSQTGTHDPDVDQLFSSHDLHEMLGRCDYVVLAVPLTPQTEKMIGEAELRSMPPHSYLINIARGNVIDEKALIRALQEGWIGGAGLDVTSPEPLPTDSPLYDLPNVILTPHISGASERYAERLGLLFVENLRRYRAGEPLLNRVDPQRGY